MNSNLEGRDYRDAWAAVTEQSWPNMLSHDFANKSRRFAFDIIKEEAKRIILSYVCKGRAFSHYVPTLCEVGFGQAHDFEHFFRFAHIVGMLCYVGFDITPQFVEFARRRFPGYDFLCGGFSALCTQAFDVMYVRHVFEHQGPALFLLHFGMMLDAARHCAVVTWFLPPGPEPRHRWKPHGGFGEAGAWANRYDAQIVADCIAAHGFSLEIHKSGKTDEIYVMRRE